MVAPRHPGPAIALVNMISSDHSPTPAILQIVPSLDTGGAERTTIDIAAALVRDGLAALAARLASVPFVTTYHGIYNASNRIKRFYNSVMVRSDAIIANSEWTAAHI